MSGVNTFRNVRRTAPCRAGMRWMPEVLNRVPQRPIAPSSKEARYTLEGTRRASCEEKGMGSDCGVDDPTVPFVFVAANAVTLIIAINKNLISVTSSGVNAAPSHANRDFIVLG